jgi:PAS domain S-box-containing protein
MIAQDLEQVAVEAAPVEIIAASATLPQVALSDLELGQWSEELLDPNYWEEILSRYGRTMRVAVGLTDIKGNLLGSCHNPQLVWSLARRGTMESRPGWCAFCLASRQSCNAVADALATSKVIYVNDAAGLTHAAIPLFLGNQPLGALIVGQAFAQYPQPLALQRVAKLFGTSQQELWNAAVRQVPISHATLRLYADLLASFGQAFVRQRYAALLDKKLHEMNQRYRLMIEGSKDRALFTVDGMGCVTSWNPGAERLLGYTESEIQGQDYSRFFTPEDVRCGINGREIRMSEQTGWVETEGQQVRKDGTRFLSETVTARLGEAGKREYGRLLHDVTEERIAAEAVLQAQKLESIGVLAGGIAHDFNNLLTSILGNVSLAMEGLPADHASRPMLDIAERSSLKAAALTSQLLAYAGNGTVVATRFDLSKLISEILPLIGTSIPKTVKLELSLPPGLLWIKANSSEIQQIVMNLVINGAEAIGPEGGKVVVSTGVTNVNGREEDQPTSVYLEVQDSGCGMDEVTKNRIFDPFFTTKFIGRGLGLAAVSGIVRRLKGRLTVESIPGGGSTFRIVLPGVPAQRPETKVLVRGDLQGTGTILVVDDDPLIRDLARSVLEQYGYSVMTAENGQAGVRAFRSNADTIIAVLLDLTMPIMGGVEAFHLMNDIRPDIPIVISTGYGESAVQEQFTNALGGIIQKPYTVAELGEKIGAAVAAKGTCRIIRGRAQIPAAQMTGGSHPSEVKPRRRATT